MPVVKLSAIRGTDIPSLINSLERQRKELEFILASLDNANVIELSGNLINGGIVKSEFVESGAGNGVIQADVDTLKVQVGIHQEDIGLLETEVFTNIPQDIGLLETEVFTNIPQDIANARIIDSITSDPVSPVIGQMWLRSDL